MNINNKPLILVTNDDGINSNGLAILIEVAKEFGQIVVVAPDRGKSAKSHSITTEEPIYYTFIKEEEGIKYYSCTGTPVDCVKIALNRILETKPSYVLSGINHGSNSSINIIYSGTMAAAIEAFTFGITSIGFSLTDHNINANLDASNFYCKQILSSILNKKMENPVCLNINFPNIPLDTYKGIKVCRQSKGFWTEEFVERQQPHGKNYYWLTGEYHNLELNANDTDEWALKNGFVSIVPIQIDFTDYKEIKQLNNLLNGN